MNYVYIIKLYNKIIYPKIIILKVYTIILLRNKNNEMQLFVDLLL